MGSIEILGRVLVFSTVIKSAASGAFTSVDFGGEVTDNVDAHDIKINNSRITITDNFNLIKIRARVNMEWQANTIYQLTVLKNGAILTSPIPVLVNTSARIDGISPTVFGLSTYRIPCVKDDFFELAVNQNGLGAVNITLNCWLEAELSIY